MKPCEKILDPRPTQCGMHVTNAATARHAAGEAIR
jgi:hypothetical protein